MAKTTLPAKVEEYDALQAQSTFSASEKKAFKELSAYIAQHVKESIWWYWELGQKVAKIHRESKEKKQLYGKQILLRLARGLGYKTARQLHTAMDVVDCFKTKKSFGEYIKLKGEAGNQLYWSHLVYLANVGDPDTRMQLAASALDQCWTADELWQKIKEVCARRQRGSGAPVKTRIPTSARACLTHVQSQAHKFITNVESAWTGDAYDFCHEIAEIPADKLSTQLLEDVQRTQAEVVAMQERAEDMVEVLIEAESSIAERMEEQAAIEAEAAAEADEAAEAEAEVEAIDPEVADDDEPDAINIGKLKSQEARKARAAARAKKRKGRRRTTANA